MNLDWYKSRIKSMSVREIVYYRLPQLLYNKLYLRMFANYFNFSKYSIKLNPSFKKQTYCKDEIIKIFESNQWTNKYNYFETFVDLSTNINWRHDYKNNITSPINKKGSFNKQDKNIHGDIKYLFELSRFHFLPFLAFKTVISANSNKSPEIYSILNSWKKQNPYLKSIHYTSGIEVAIRSLNLIYTHQILNSFDLLCTRTDKTIKQLISCNYHFLKNNLSLYSSSNNHLVAELMGLVVISSYFSDKKFKQPNWESKFLKLLNTKLLKDGVDDELSSHYHLTVIDHFLNGILFLQRSGRHVPLIILNKLSKSFRFIKYIHYQEANSNFGDNDNSFLINPFFVKNFSLAKSLIDSGSYFYNQKFIYNNNDPRNYLLFGSPYLNSTKQEIKNISSKVFETSGYAFLFNKKANMKCTFDFGRIGDNRLQAHGHSDQLSFTLQLKDIIYIVDPGTYQYHESESKWRNYFRGITAHNTISVNNKNHAVALNRMSWFKSAKTFNISFDFLEKIDSIQATTNAFKKEGVLHTRKIISRKNDREICIEDYLKTINNLSEKRISFHLHFNPNVLIKKTENKIILQINENNKVILYNELFKYSKIIKGNKKLPYGWYSGSYDNIQETSSLLLEFEIKQDKTIVTKISY